MEAVGSTYTADFSTFRGGREPHSATPASASLVASEGGSGSRAAGTGVPEQQGWQLSKQSPDEFKPYTQAGSESNQDSRTGIPAAPGSQEKQDPRIQAEVEKLKAIEEKVKAHEAAHKSAGGAATGPISYTYTRGPDGRSYITGGEVPITISTGKTPQETINRMQQVIQAALAPADPSPQDRAVAAQAFAIQQEARQEKTAVTGQGTPPAVAGSSQTQAGGVTTQDVQRAYGDPAVSGTSDAASSDSETAASLLIGATRMPSAALTPAGITGFSQSRPVSYFA